MRALLGDLLSELLGLGLLDLGHLSGGLVAQATATPVFADLLTALVEVGLHLKKSAKLTNMVNLHTKKGSAQREK